MEREEKQKPQSTEHEGHGGGQQMCHSCGWVYPNPHPSAKQRRAHKKHCGKGEGDGEVGPKPAAGGGNGAGDGRKGPDEEGSDEEYRKRAVGAAAEKSKPAEQEGNDVVYLGGDEEKVSFGSEGGVGILGKDATLGSNDVDITLDRHASLPNDHVQVTQINCVTNQLASGTCLVNHSVSGKTDIHAATMQCSVSTKAVFVNGSEEETECCPVQSMLDDSLNINGTDVGKCREDNEDASIPTGPILSCDPASCSSVIGERQKMDKYREINNLDFSSAIGTRMTSSPEEVSLNGRELQSNAFHLQDRQMDVLGKQSQSQSFSLSGSQFECLGDALHNRKSKGNQEMTLGNVLTPPNKSSRETAQMNPNVTISYDGPVVPSDLFVVKADISAVSIPSLVQMQGNDHFHGVATNELHGGESASNGNVNGDRSSSVNSENEAEGYIAKLEGSEGLGLDVLGGYPHARVKGSPVTPEITLDGQPAASHETYAATVKSEEVEGECPHEGQEAGLSSMVVSGDCNVLADAGSVAVTNITQAKETAKISDESQFLEESVISYTDVDVDCRCELRKTKRSHSDRESIPQPKCKVPKSGPLPEMDFIHNLLEKNQDAGLTMSLGHLENVGRQHSGQLADQKVIEDAPKESAVRNNINCPATQTEHQSEYIKAQSDFFKVAQDELPLQNVQMEKISGSQLDSENDLQEKLKVPAVGNDNCHSVKEAFVQNPHIENGLAIPLRKGPNLSDDIEIDLCRENVHNYAGKEPVSSIVEIHSLQKSVALDDSKTNGEADVSGISNEPLQENQIHVESEEQSDSYAAATSFEFTSQKENADGLRGFISDGMRLAERHSTDDRPVHNAQTPRTTNTQTGEDLQSSNLAVEGSPAANGVDNNYFFEEPSVDEEPGRRSVSREIFEGGSRSVHHEIQEPLVMANVELGRLSISHEIQEPGRRSVSHEIELVDTSRHEPEEKGKNEEITVNVIKSNSGRTHVPLKSLLAEAYIESKEEDHNTSLLAKKGRAFQGERHGYGNSNGSSFNRAAHKEWNSPAKLPTDQNEKKVKGRPRWIPFICCSSII